MQSDEIHAHIHKTYFTLRVGLAVLAAALPILLVVVGYLATAFRFNPRSAIIISP